MALMYKALGLDGAMQCIVGVVSLTSLTYYLMVFILTFDVATVGV